MSSGETRNEKKKDKEKNTRYSRQRGETIKNTDAQIKTEAERGGSRHLESKMLQLQSRWGKQESRAGKRQRPRSSGVRSRPFPSCAFCLSTTSAGEYTKSSYPDLPNLCCSNRAPLLVWCAHTHQLASAFAWFGLSFPTPTPQVTFKACVPAWHVTGCNGFSSAHAHVSGLNTRLSPSAHTSFQRWRLPGGCLL